MTVPGMAGVVGEVIAERLNQIDGHNWTPEHDDEHNLAEWAWLLQGRAHQLAHPFAEHVADARRLLIETAAIAIAAVESLDRRTTPNHHNPEATG